MSDITQFYLKPAPDAAFEHRANLF